MWFLKIDDLFRGLSSIVSLGSSLRNVPGDPALTRLEGEVCLFFIMAYLVVF